MSNNAARQIEGGESRDDRARPLNRSPFFVAYAASGRGQILLLDRFEIALDELALGHEVYARALEPLDLGRHGKAIDSDQLIELLAEQFDAASEFVYGHPSWENIRGGSQRALLAYILETRHYLAAAPSRMSSSIETGMGLSPLTLLLSHHLLEEWDHEVFFTNALVAMDCPEALVRSARPLPSTLEWVHLSRFIGSKGALNAAACSGFMEYSSTETEAVKGWHVLLTQKGLIPETATQAIFSHFETDLGFDHASNWQRAIRCEPVVSLSVAQDVLNDVCAIAEMIYRWLSALDAGASADIVTAMQVSGDQAYTTASFRRPHELSVKMFNGLPVPPSTLLSAINWGDGSATPASQIATAASYAFRHLSRNNSASGGDFMPLVAAYSASWGEGAPDGAVEDIQSLLAIVESWLCTIDGHELWGAMLEMPSDALVTGYFLENFHYLASATRHITAAIASSDLPAVRRAYLAHLEDELEHCDILGAALSAVANIDHPERFRPLPTTMAFVGYLELLARSNWRAYVIVSTFLQSSLSVSRTGGRHAEFYETLMQRNPRLASLVQTMATHDEIDDGLDHDTAHIDRLTAILAESPATISEIGQAAISASLGWSFLDGILQHYSCGSGAILQRAGWHA